MEVRDPVHGSIHILKEEEPILKAEFFQRLRNIKQLGFSEYVFPGATHTRFIHSIGVMNIGNMAFDKLFRGKIITKDHLRVKQTFKLACLLHDIGHAPLSHSTESVMPQLSELKIPEMFLSAKDKSRDRQASHEDYTIKAIADSSFAESFKEVEKSFGVERRYIADLITGHTQTPEYFTLDKVNYFPLLHQLVSSELDCDRMDYLLRDSYFCGVSYGSYDLDWLLDNLEPAITDGVATLGISERAVITFDDFLLSRYHMFVMVYFHYRAVCLEQLLIRYFKDAPDEYRIPADIEKYIEHDDYHLMKVLRHSNNKYAQAVVKNQTPEKIFESFNAGQLGTLEEVQKYLENINVEYIRCSSKGRLSKYYTADKGSSKSEYTMKVVRTQKMSNSLKYLDINEATDLFQKFAGSHAINRLHCDYSELSEQNIADIRKIIEGA
ncbi:HD domain-containing protein [Bacteriovorax sp. Seq25_V]|uniref:HD domain-containing protein n=1 Tax=Bacteriovorax sp. Seq25_V TaxID=1201288 RepID=UPI000389F497|nr:HD domain-containing protein [Bacteriovorax sp. Seq25_V]EQC45344.1 HD domain protein [Bacteriovorax sp. Seq25_V]